MHVPKTGLEAWISQLIEAGTLYKFYKTDEWLELRGEILKDNHGECEWCRAQGKVAAAETVHHIRTVKQYPALALSRTYTDADGEHQQLIALCHDCHDKAHGRFGGRKTARAKRVDNLERW